MSAYSTNVGEKFAASLIKVFYETAVTPMITNQEYEGTIKGGGADRLNILSLTAGDLQDYDGSDLDVDDPTESEATLLVDQEKAYYFRIKSWDKFKSYADKPESDLIQQYAGKLQEAVDTYVLGLYGDVGSGNRVGTDYTTGTVEIAATTGAVTGTGTTFTSAMVGKGFKASGHSVWYRVKTYTSGTAIVIEDDSDDETSAYTGGAISAGATYTIEANTAVDLSSTTDVYEYIVELKAKLDGTKTPKSGRWLVVNSHVVKYLLTSTYFTHATPAGDNVVRNGLIGEIAGFKVYQNEEIAGDSTNGFWIMAGHTSAICFAEAFVESGIEDLQGNFGKAYKGLNCYGAKVVDRRRKALAALYCK